MSLTSIVSTTMGEKPFIRHSANPPEKGWHHGSWPNAVWAMNKQWFCLSKWLGKKNAILWHVTLNYVSATWDKVLLEQSHVHLLTYYLWPLCKTLAELTLTETTRTTKPKIFPYPALYRKVCCSLLYSNIMENYINWFSDVKPHVFLG